MEFAHVLEGRKQPPSNRIETPKKVEPMREPLSEELGRRKNFPLKKIGALCIIVLFIGVLVWYSSQFLSLKTLSREDLVNYALSLINSDRQSKGLQNVTLSDVDSGQRHADEMLAYHFLSHWDTKGFKPYMRYTLEGGKGAVGVTETTFSMHFTTR